MSRRRRSMSSSGPIQMALTAVCGPTTCSMAWTNSSARRPWVTITSPIIREASMGVPGPKAVPTAGRAGLIRLLRRVSKLLQCATKLRRCGSLEWVNPDGRDGDAGDVGELRPWHPLDRLTWGDADGGEGDPREVDGQLTQHTVAARLDQAGQRPGRPAVKR